jgi:thioredoxin 1
MSIRAVKFSATWCGPCTVVSKQLEGLDIQNVDIDQDTEGLTKEANVRAVPTIVFYKDDKEVARHAGLITKKEYLSMLESL